MFVADSEFSEARPTILSIDTPLNADPAVAKGLDVVVGPVFLTGHFLEMKRY